MFKMNLKLTNHFCIIVVMLTMIKNKPQKKNTNK